VQSNDPQILETIKFGSNYILDRCFPNGKLESYQFSETIREPVSYLKHDREKDKIEVDVHYFEHPFYMILPALVLTPGISILDDRCVKIKNSILKMVQENKKLKIVLLIHLT